MDKNGQWRVNTTIKGFTKELGAIVSSYSTTGDHVLLGKSKSPMLIAWQRMKALGGGVVAADQGETVFELTLELGGAMFAGDMPTFIDKVNTLRELLKAYS